MRYVYRHFDFSVLTFAALISSSARHSAIDLMFLNEASLAPKTRPLIMIGGASHTHLYRVTTQLG